MPRTRQITSLTNPRVKQVVRLREHRHRRKTGLFIAEGQREIDRALAAGLTVRELYTAPDLLAQHPGAAQQLAAWAARLPETAEHLEVPPPVLRKMAYLREPEGLLAVVEQPRWSLADLPPVTPDTLYLVAVGIEKPGNLGAMVRTADAAGCTAVIAAGAPVDAFNPNTIRTSTAAVFSLPTVAADEPAVLDHLQQHNLRILAATLQGAMGHTQTDMRGPTAIVIGPEDVGLSPPWLDAADRTRGARVRIPMQGRLVDSLNASVAAGILLFEAVRQRSTR